MCLFSPIFISIFIKFYTIEKKYEYDDNAQDR